MRKIAIVLSIVHFIAAVVVIALLLPASVPLHYNVAGEVDNWGSKWVYLLFAAIPAIIAAAYALYHAKAKDQRNRQMEEKLVPVMALVFIPIFWLMLPKDGAQSRMDVLPLCGVMSILGLLIVFISNYLGKIRQNRHLGIKLPWTLKNETVWNKTHRLGGITGVIGGVVIILGSVVGMFMTKHAFAWCFGGLAVGLILLIVVPGVYSWRLYNQLKQEGKL